MCKNAWFECCVTKIKVTLSVRNTYGWLGKGIFREDF